MGVIAVLCAFIRDQTSAAGKPSKPPRAKPATDIQAALTVVGTRNPKNDSPTTVIDLDNTELAGAQLYFSQLSDADLTGADLTGANLNGANLTNAGLARANLVGANLTGANLGEANLSSAILGGANLTGAVWPRNVPAPAGWVRDPSSDQLSRAT